ncbi:MAG: nucleotidyltransferase family protein, partial [Prochlorothrix sp.]
MKPWLVELSLRDLLAQRLRTTPEEIAAFCRRYQMVEFGLFGSVLREDFKERSDVDVLVSYAPGHRLCWNEWWGAKVELEGRFGRSVDLVERALLKNPYRRAEILATYRVVY